MKILWPSSLFLLGLIPLTLGVYIWVMRRRRRYAVRYSSLWLVREAIPHQAWIRRHLPFALFMLALISLVLALARPMAVIQVPTGKSTIILAIDVSRSMCSTDIPPNRLEAAKRAAVSFVKQQAAGTQIGIVAFSGFAALIQTPTTDRQVLESAIEGLSTERRTAIGSAIVTSLDAISEIDNSVAPIPSGNAPDPAPAPLPEGQYAPHIIVLLTDGVSNTGISPLDAAKLAADRRVRIYTIGFGTAGNASPMTCGDQIGDPFGGGLGFGQQFGGFGFRRGIDEETLKTVASLTAGEYYAATSAGELQNVFKKLPVYLTMQQKTSEISFIFAAAAAFFVLAAITLSLLWHRLI